MDSATDFELNFLSKNRTFSIHKTIYNKMVRIL